MRRVKHFLESLDAHEPILILNFVVHRLSHLIQHTVVATKFNHLWDDILFLFKCSLRAEDFHNVSLDHIASQSRRPFFLTCLEVCFELLFEISHPKLLWCSSRLHRAHWHSVQLNRSALLFQHIRYPWNKQLCFFLLSIQQTQRFPMTIGTTFQFRHHSLAWIVQSIVTLVLGWIYHLMALCENLNCSLFIPHSRHNAHLIACHLWLWQCA